MSIPASFEPSGNINDTLLHFEKASDSQKTEVLVYLQNIDKLNIPTASKETIDKLKKTLEDVTTAAKSDKTIVSLAKSVLQKIDTITHQESYQVFKGAASKGQAKTAKFGLQKEFEATYEPAKRLEELRKVIQPVVTCKFLLSIESDQQKIDQLNKELKSLDEQFKNELFEYEKIKNALDAQTIKPLVDHPVYIQKRAVFKVDEDTPKEAQVHEFCIQMGAPDAVVPSEISFLKMAIQQRSGAIKSQQEGLIQPLVTGGIECTKMLENQKLSSAIMKKLDLPDSQQKCIVQALIANWDLHSTNALSTVIPNEANQQCSDKTWECQLPDGKWKQMDVFHFVTLKLSGEIDDQTKIRENPDTPTSSFAIMESAEKWLSSYENATHSPRKEHLKGEWEYQDADGSWGRASSFDALVALRQTGTVVDTTPIRPITKEMTSSERTVGADDFGKELLKACESKWTFAMFDNPYSFDTDNIFHIFDGKPCLPIRLFTLGLEVSDLPLTKEVKQWVTDLAEKRALIEKSSQQGRYKEIHTLWPSLPDATQAYLLDGFRKNQLLDSKHGGVPQKHIQAIAEAFDKTKRLALPTSEDQEAARKITQKSGLTEQLEALKKQCLSSIPEVVKKIEPAIQRLQEVIKNPHLALEDLNSYVDSVITDIQCSPEFKKLKKNKETKQIHADLLTMITNLKETAQSCDSDKDFPKAVGQYVKNFYKAYEALVTPPKIMEDTYWLKPEEQQAYFKRLDQLIKTGDITSLNPAERQAYLERIDRSIEYVKTSQVPTTTGLILAQFPKFDFYINLLTELEVKKQYHPPQIVPEGFREKVRRDIFLEDIRFPSKSGKNLGYSVLPCEEILEQALQADLFPGGEDNPDYKKALQEVQAATP